MRKQQRVAHSSIQCAGSFLTVDVSLLPRHLAPLHQQKCSNAALRPSVRTKRRVALCPDTKLLLSSCCVIAFSL